MFETTKEVLSLFGEFAVIGFFLGAVYNVFKLIRLTFPKIRLLSDMLDYIFALIFGLTLFIFSVELGTGFFRLYYVAAAFIGFAIYMLTIGFLTKPLSKLTKAVLSVLSKLLLVPIKIAVYLIADKISAFFVKIAQKTTKLYENRKIHLKKDTDLVYNVSNNTIDKVYQKGGERRSVIKAKVRKNS